MDQATVQGDGGGGGVTVKKEKVDETEINLLAAEMAEKNRQKMLSQATQIAQQNQASQQALQRAGGQQMITYYFNRDKEKNGEVEEDSFLPKKVEEKKKGVIDEDSQRGRFGWTTIHTSHIPYLFRREEKYCAVRMVEIKLLNKYLSFLPQEITTCINVRSYFITESEARLLTEINTKHCELQFGRDYFTTKDLVVKVSEAKHFHRFLDTCFKKLVQRSTEQSEFCGFVRINGESVVPYTVKEKVKYVPLFYFEGETDTLKTKAEKIDNWELAYLKFCCKVQGIRNELFASDTCAVVSLDDVKQYFPKETQFEDWWPQKTAEPMRVVTQGAHAGSNSKGLGSWTQRPATQPPAAPAPTSAASVSGVSKNVLASSSHRHLGNHHASKTGSSTALPNLPQLGLNSLVNNVGRSSSSALHQIGATTISSAGLPSLPTSTNAVAAAAAAYNLSNINQMSSIYNQWASMVNNIGSLNGMNGINGMNNMAAVAAAYGNNPSMQSLLASLSSEQARRLGVNLPGLSPHNNLTAAVAAAAAHQQHAVATAARTLRSHSTSTTQANRHSTTMSSSSSSNKQATAHQQQQQQLVNNLNQLGYSNYLSQQQSAMDSLLSSTQRNAYGGVSVQPPAAHSNSSSSAHHVRNGVHGSKSSSNGSSSSNNNNSSKAPPPLIPVNGSTGGGGGHKGTPRTVVTGVDKHKLVDVPAYRPDHSRRELPYIVRKMVVGTRQVLCINHVAYNFGATSMVALQDLINEFFPTATLASCIEVFTNVLSIVVYKANWHQVYALMEAWGTDSTPDVVPLIYSEDLVRSLTQMKYIFQRNPAGLSTAAQNSSKRIRTT
ncbi:uncharacterized protein LOC108678981 isoform X1 [Hyalella azteca]|uniref:Uncharacterized protein LOC108678981 isoform X1 n=1 Tax=Hyalella azteca TaxID=294128 RepID=A0A8B7PA74_HYAAZ|nr:uncharacterized protein LOC108678981 isoform X2 [Hyalella azteca]XP_018022968.1 uncharacterized protein LOC108678981 isoform X1 [Hyalella azteca]